MGYCFFDLLSIKHAVKQANWVKQILSVIQLVIIYTMLNKNDPFK